MLPEAFCEKMKTLLGEEYEAFLAALDRPRAVGLWVNPLKLSLRDQCAHWSWQSASPFPARRRIYSFSEEPSHAHSFRIYRPRTQILPRRHVLPL